MLVVLSLTFSHLVDLTIDIVDYLVFRAGLSLDLVELFFGLLLLELSLLDLLLANLDFFERL